jgi:hypothetical protein
VAHIAVLFFTCSLLRPAAWRIWARSPSARPSRLSYCSRAPRIGRGCASDAAFGFWDFAASRSTDLDPPVVLRLQGGRLAPDLAAMRRGVAEALGGACDPRWDPTALRSEGLEAPSLSAYADLESAARTLQQADWSRDGRIGRRHPAAEAARLAACLIYSGEAEAAQRLLRSGWPPGQPGLRETERQLAARLACSPWAAAIRRLNGPKAPYVGSRCRPMGRDQVAVHSVFDR